MAKGGVRQRALNVQRRQLEEILMREWAIEGNDGYVKSERKLSPS